MLCFMAIISQRLVIPSLNFTPVGIKLLPPNHVSMLYWKFTEMMPVSFNVTLNGLWLIMATQFLSLKVWCLTDVHDSLLYTLSTTMENAKLSYTWWSTKDGSILSLLWKSCWISIVNYQEQINILIAETLEKLQPLNPDLYGTWYSQLYPPYGNTNNWNVKTLHTLEQLILDYTNWKQCYSLNSHSTINKFSLSL